MQTLTWYRQRLGRMGPAELVARLGSALTLPRDLLMARSAAAPVEYSGLLPATGKALQGGAGIEPQAYVEAADRIAAGRLPAFGSEIRFEGGPEWNRDPKTGVRAPLALGRAIDYRDESRVGDIKYLWEPNRHLHLVTLAQAYALTGAPRHAEVLRSHVRSWLDQCPHLRGPNWASSLELGIRLINWSLVWELIGNRDDLLFAGAEGRRLRNDWLTSISQHLAFIASNLSRYSSANNHLVGEAAGLFIGALSWPLWPECKRYEELAAGILEQECRRQISDDGVHREQAFSYAQFVYDFFLLAALKGRANGREFSAGYWDRLELMLGFIAAIMDVDGQLPQVGDADDGYVVRLSPEPDFCPYRSLLATGAVLFERPEFKAKAGALDDKTRWLLGPEADDFERLPAAALPLPLPRAFPHGGYYVLGTDLDGPDEVRVLMDVGPLGYLSLAAHGHADALSILMTIRGRQILVDPGTFAYHTQPEWRAYFKSTAAHNTIVVDGLDQSESGGNFMWVSHAPAECIEWHSTPEEDRVVGLHRGYERLADPVVHRRAVRMLKGKSRIEIGDALLCSGGHTITRMWHFAEDCEVHLEEDGAIRVNSGDVQVRIAPEEPVEAQVYVASCAPPRGWVSRHFDQKAPASTVAWRSRIEGSVLLRTSITYNQ